LEQLSRASIKEIRTPILEMTELFIRGIGEGTDVVSKEMYTFLDRGERSCTLRPEGTASVARALIQNGISSNPLQKLWYMGPMFRYERPQAGRQRQFHQLGVEFIGHDSVRSDVEIIALAWDILGKLGIKELNLEINTLGDTKDRSNFQKSFLKWLETNKDSLDSDSQNRISKNPLRILVTKNIQTKKVLENAPRLFNFLSEKSHNRYLDLKRQLKVLKIPYVENFNLVRGLDYYTHTAFEITSGALGSQATVCGGGRYDDLIKQMGGPNTPAIGFAIGLERLILLAGKELEIPRNTDIYIINKGLFKRYFIVTKYGEKTFTEKKYFKNDCFIFGSESKGIPNKILKEFENSKKISIPMIYGSRSLNLANSVSIVVYEALRQNKFQFL